MKPSARRQISSAPQGSNSSAAARVKATARSDRTKSIDGQIQLGQVVNSTASGDVSGSFWGLLIGVLFHNPLLGAVLGARAAR
ncbi:MAG: DUF1269 domain-containing protein [Methylocella sp.]